MYDDSIVSGARRAYAQRNEAFGRRHVEHLAIKSHTSDKNTKANTQYVVSYCRKLNNELEKLISTLKGDFERKKDIGGYRDMMSMVFADEEYGSQATMPELVDQVKTFLCAGHDTSASMLAWSYYFLSQNPHCLERLREEHDSVFGPEASPEIVAQMITADPKLLGRLDYTLSVLKETLRFAPIGDGVRYAPKGYVIRTLTGAEFDVTDTILNIQHRGLQLRESAWGPTALDFDPDRFMPGKPQSEAFYAFSKGNRDCIGRNMAWMEVLSALVFIDLLGKSSVGSDSSSIQF